MRNVHAHYTTIYQLDTLCQTIIQLFWFLCAVFKTAPRGHVLKIICGGRTYFLKYSVF